MKKTKQKHVMNVAVAILAEKANSKVAAILEAKRQESGLTQKQLADKAGLNQSRVSDVENLRWGGLTITSIVRILDALGYDLVISARRRK